MRRSFFRRVVAAAVSGAVLVGAAWAGVGLTPVSTDGGDGVDKAALPLATPKAQAAAAALATEPATGAPTLAGLTGVLPAGQFLVGASTVSLAPKSNKWQKTGCYEIEQPDPQGQATHLAGLVQKGNVPPGWPKSDDCIYLGGFGIGPSRASTGIDPYAGVNVRSIAISNGTKAGTVVWQMIDIVGYFARYRADLCTGCGILDMRRTIAAATKIPEAGIAINATHTHGGADGYGAWGGIPDWYRAELRDDIVNGAYDALRDMKPATIGIGQLDARQFDGQRRDTYFSSADYGATWLQAKALPVNRSEQRLGGKVIATAVNYAAHPTVVGSVDEMHSDWPGTTAKEMGAAFGGTGFVFEGALGNVSVNSPRNAVADYTGDGKKDKLDHVIQLSKDFTDFIGQDIKRGASPLTSNDVKAEVVTIDHPVTNWAMGGLGVVGMLDREFTPGSDGAGIGGAYIWDKGSSIELPGGSLPSAPPGAPPGRGCQAASPMSVKTQVAGFKVGNLGVITGPGETFGTMANVVKSRARQNIHTMYFGQTNDSLGYILQHFEADTAGGVTSNVGLGEYEEEFLLDRCFGDHVLDAQLKIAGNLGLGS